MNKLACAVNTCAYQIDDDVETYITEKRDGFYE